MKTTSLPSVKDRVKTICSCRKGSMDDKQYEATVEYNLTQERNQAYTSLIEGIEVALKRRFVTQPQEYKDSDANVWREGYNRALNDILEKVVKPLYGKGIDMNNLKIGDVKIIKPSIDSSQDTLNELLLTLVDAVNELNGHTPVKPEKTLEEKFEEYRDDEEGIDCAYRCIVDLARIAEEHYKDKR